MALVGRVSSRGCLTVATTHYSELKTFAYVRPGDVKRQCAVRHPHPSTHLRTHHRGSRAKSNAFPIARRLRLPEEIITRAQSFLADDAVQVEDLIRSLTEDNRQAAEDRQKRPAFAGKPGS